MLFLNANISCVYNKDNNNAKTVKNNQNTGETILQHATYNQLAQPNLQVFCYDNIGNCITAQENGINVTYDTNQITQNGSNFTLHIRPRRQPNKNPKQHRRMARKIQRQQPPDQLYPRQHPSRIQLHGSPIPQKSLQERSQIMSGSMLMFLNCILWILTSMISLNAQTPFGEGDESYPSVKYPPKDLRFEPTDRFNDLVERYRHILLQDNFAEFRNTRFCLDGVDVSFNYFMLCGMGNRWQRVLGGQEWENPTEPPSKEFKCLQVVHNAKGYVYGKKNYKRGELQTLIADIVLERFNFNNRLPYCYLIWVQDNPTLQTCWYFLAVLHVFAENRISYVDTPD